MRRKRPSLPSEKAEMDMSPMIDCVFLLLIFFIVVSTQAEVMIDPKVKPTVADSSTIQESNIGRIVINAYYDENNAVIYSDEDSEAIEENTTLQSYIREQKKLIQANRPGEDLTLHLRCDRALLWRDIQKVKEAAAKEGVINVNFASYQKDPTN